MEMLRKLTPEKVLHGIFVGLLAYMPFHLFLSRWLSLYTGGLGVWDAGKDIVTLFGLAVGLFIAWRQKLHRDKFFRWIIILSLSYAALHLVFAIFNWNGLYHRSFLLGTLYNGRLMAYLFIGMVVARTYKPLSRDLIVKVVLITSTITCLFALAQYVLPKDLMTHFGYSIQRGVKPNFFIDDKPDFPRVMSTVRDPNSYGAFLILPLLLLWSWWNKGLTRRNRLLVGGLIVLHGLALLLTFSRGAWIGMLLGAAMVTYLYHRKAIWRNIKKHVAIAAVLLLVVIGGVGYFRNSYVFQNVFLHKDQGTVLTDPNELRIELQQQAVDAIEAKPLGHGPGTAGLVSIGSPKGTFLPENYYLQIGYELGVIGLAMFLSILALTYLRLNQHVDEEHPILRIAVIGCFLAYLFISTLIHLWSNESVAAQWWLLAGVLTGAAPVVTKKNQRAIRAKRS
jgi:hypothetical protein